MWPMRVAHLLGSSTERPTKHKGCWYSHTGDKQQEHTNPLFSVKHTQRVLNGRQENGP